MNCRSSVGLGEYEPIFRTREPAHVVRELNRAPDSIFARQQSQAAILDGLKKYFLVALRKFVFPVTEEREVIIGQPLQERLTLTE